MTARGSRRLSRRRNEWLCLAPGSNDGEPHICLAVPTDERESTCATCAGHIDPSRFVRPGFCPSVSRKPVGTGFDSCYSPFSDPFLGMSWHCLRRLCWGDLADEIRFNLARPIAADSVCRELNVFRHADGGRGQFNLARHLGQLSTAVPRKQGLREESAVPPPVPLGT